MLDTWLAFATGHTSPIKNCRQDLPGFPQEKMEQAFINNF